MATEMEQNETKEFRGEPIEALKLIKELGDKALVASLGKSMTDLIPHMKTLPPDSELLSRMSGVLALVLEMKDRFISYSIQDQIRQELEKLVLEKIEEVVTAQATSGQIPS